MKSPNGLRGLITRCVSLKTPNTCSETIIQILDHFKHSILKPKQDYTQVKSWLVNYLFPDAVRNTNPTYILQLYLISACVASLYCSKTEISSMYYKNILNSYTLLTAPNLKKLVCWVRTSVYWRKERLELPSSLTVECWLNEARALSEALDAVCLPLPASH